MSNQVERYCTECPYFKDIIYRDEQWYGARCNKDGHTSSPSMYAIKMLYDDCPCKIKRSNK
jgi:hypothetical protein